MVGHGGMQAGIMLQRYPGALNLGQHATGRKRDHGPICMGNLKTHPSKTLSPTRPHLLNKDITFNSNTPYDSMEDIFIPTMTETSSKQHNKNSVIY